MNLDLFGYNVNISKKLPPGAQERQELQQPTMDQSRVRDALDTLQKYQRGKEQLDAKIVDNEMWYRSRHWDLIRKQYAKDKPEPVTAYLFNILANKHADAMDNFPKPNFLPKDRDDVQESQRLSGIVPVILKSTNYRKVYSNAWWYKLKHGFVIKGMFWDAEAGNGLGDIKPSYIDALNCAWEPGITDIQDSKNFFVWALEDTEYLKKQMPEIADQLSSDKPIVPKQYVQDDQQDLSDKTLMIDWYYFTDSPSGKRTLQLCKLAGDVPYFCSEDYPEFVETGYYECNQVPVEFDVLFPEEGTITGFGFIDIAKNPQVYIDKLDAIISENAFKAGRKRFFYKRGGGINMQQMADWSQEFVEVEGGIGEDNIREWQVDSLHPFIVQHRQEKIAEIKEISSNDVFNSGTGGKGVTAAAAIYALQEAGNKISRDMIATSYEVFRREMTFLVEHIRQLYDVTRTFRIDKPDGRYDFVDYDNSGLQPQPQPTMYEGEEPKYRKPEFDIDVVPEKSNPYSTMMHNEMAKEMFGAGFFNPQMAESALVALEMMTFEGKDKIAEMIRQNSMMYQQMMQMQQTLARVQPVLQAMAAGRQGVPPGGNGGVLPG